MKMEMKIKKIIDDVKAGHVMTAPLEKLIAIAERVLAINGKMPKKTVQQSGIGSWKNRRIKLGSIEIAENETIDACTLAFAGALLSKKEIEIIIEYRQGKSSGMNPYIIKQEVSELAAAIVKTQEEKLKEKD